MQVSCARLSPDSVLMKQLKAAHRYRCQNDLWFIIIEVSKENIKNRENMYKKGRNVKFSSL